MRIDLIIPIVLRKQEEITFDIEKIIQSGKTVNEIDLKILQNQHDKISDLLKQIPATNPFEESFKSVEQFIAVNQYVSDDEDYQFLRHLHANYLHFLRNQRIQVFQ